MDYILPVFPSVNCFSPQRTDSSTATPSAAFSNYLTQVTNKIKQFSLTGLVFTMQCGPQSAWTMQPLCWAGAGSPQACLCLRPRQAACACAICACRPARSTPNACTLLSRWAVAFPACPALSSAACRLHTASTDPACDQTRRRAGRRCQASLILHGTIECYVIFDKTSYRTGLNAIKNTAPYNGVTLNFCAITLDGGPIRTSTICFDNSGLDPQHPYVIVKVRARPATPPRASHPLCQGWALCLCEADVSACACPRLGRSGALKAAAQDGGRVLLLGTGEGVSTTPWHQLLCTRVFLTQPDARRRWSRQGQSTTSSRSCLASAYTTPPRCPRRRTSRSRSRASLYSRCARGPRASAPGGCSAKAMCAR